MGLETFGLPEREATWIKEKLGLEVAVEGGTFKGGSAALLSQTYSKVFTIEKSPAMFAESRQRLAGIAHVVQLHGDTREFLPELKAEHENVLFWLDAHWCGGETYGADDECPILEELAILFEGSGSEAAEGTQGAKNFAVLIDDARLFLAPPPRPHRPAGWPSIRDISRMVPDDFDLVVHRDVVFIVPKQAGFPAYIQTLLSQPASEPATTKHLGVRARLRKIPRLIESNLRFVRLELRVVWRAIRELPLLLADRRRFVSMQQDQTWPLKMFPQIMLDRDSPAGNLGEYFWQDLFVAKKIIESAPRRHVDVGSRIDGFVAHIACVRSLEIFDLRPLPHTIDNVSFVQWDMTSPNPSLTEVSDCVSCLHTLEHIGLGRYGDRIDPVGWKKGLESLAALLERNGVLWLSVPIGRQRIEFNAHRIFAPKTIVDEARRLGLVLEAFFYLEKDGFRQSVEVDADLLMLAQKDYGLGIFLFEKA